MNAALTWLLTQVSQVEPWLRTLLAGIAIMLETSILIGVVVPGDSVVLVAATGVESWWQAVALIATVIVGALTGESIGFWLGRTFGPWLRASRVGQWVGHDRWDSAQRYVDRRGGPAVFLSRFLPVLHSLVPLTVGMGTMSYRKFLAWTAPACTLWSVLYVTVGWKAADTFRELSRELHYAGYLFVAAIVVFAIVVWVAKKLIFKAESRYLTASPAGATDPVADQDRDVD